MGGEGGSDFDKVIFLCMVGEGEGSGCKDRLSTCPEVLGSRNV